MITVETIKEKAGEQGVSISLVFKEYLHWVVLEYLFRKGLFVQGIILKEGIYGTSILLWIL